MTSLNWRYAALVWGYALAWFLVTDRVKLFAYRILDPVPVTSTASGSGVSAAITTETGDSDVERPPAVGADTAVPAFHTDTDPEDPVYHDNSDCPYAQEITRNGNNKPGKDGRRRCEWCTEHAGRRPTLDAEAPRT